jgi:hypothetical protein
MKKFLMIVVLMGGILAMASAEPMGNFHRSPHHHGHHHHHHPHIAAQDEQHPMH